MYKISVFSIFLDMINHWHPVFPAWSGIFKNFMVEKKKIILINNFASVAYSGLIVPCSLWALTHIIVLVSFFLSYFHKTFGACRISVRTSEFCNYQGVGACTIDLFKFKYCIYVTTNPPLTLFLCIVSFACYIKCWLAVNSLFLLTCTDDLSNLSSVMRPDEHRLVISWLWNTHISTQTGTHTQREREVLVGARGSGKRHFWWVL